MKYWSDMVDKYGFQDGENIPTGIEKYRSVYIQAINKLAKKHNSAIRLIAYDRPGMHNWCMVLFVPEDTMYIDRNAETSKLSLDEGMLTAIDAADAMNLDRFVETKVAIKRSFGSFLKEIK